MNSSNADPPLGDSAASDEEAAASPRFCRHCGQPLDPIRGACPRCTDPPAGVTMSAELPTDASDASSPGLTSALMLYFVLLATFVPMAFRESVETELAVTVIDAVIVFGWCVAHRRSIVPLLKPPPLFWVAVAPLIGLATFVLAHLSVEALVRVFGIERFWYTPAYLDAGYGWTVIILSICVQPALIEELAFRGIILDGMRRIMSVGEAIIVSAMLFMILHLSALSIVHLLMIGLILGWMRMRIGSLWPCMLVHFTHNLLCVLSEIRLLE